jgi:Protein of unknown function (DUF1569)
MKTLLNASERDELLGRVAALRPESRRRWGRMSASQMICHLNDSFRCALGEKYASESTNLFKRTVMKCFALWVPVRWPHGIKTRPELDPEQSGTKPSEFPADVQEFHRLFERYCAAQAFRPHSRMGPMSRKERMRWAYLHIDHHLRQFGV